MIRKEYKYGNDAREAIVKVATMIGDTLGKTLGPAGRNYQIPEGVTNDGKAILSHIRFADECEDNVSLAFHEIANRQDQDVGDGTTTAAGVIGPELAIQIIPKLPDLDTPSAGQLSVMDIARDLETEKDRAIDLLSKKVVPVATLEELEKVAFTAMEDKDAAKIVAATIFKAGKDSYTALEDGYSGKIETDVQAGIEIPLSIAADFMYTENKKAIYEGTIPVLVANHLFDDYRELQQFLKTLLSASEKGAMFPAIVIVGKQFSIPFVQTVSRIQHSSKGAVRFLLVSNTHLSDDLFEDVAAFCDAKYLDTHPKGGKKITDAVFDNCGLVEKIVVTPKGTVFYGGKGTLMNAVQETTRVQARVLQIRASLDKETNSEKRKAMERRMSEFQGGKATVYVDAKTAAEKFYLKLKVQDCMNSCKTALEGGMVRGGGLSLKEVAEELGEDSILYKPLIAPYNRVQWNNGGTLEIGEDVMDSYLVAKAGIENAVSVLKQLITIEGIIADHPASLVEGLREAIQ